MLEISPIKSIIKAVNIVGANRYLKPNGIQQIFKG
jgi:hypothetical protein